VTAPRRIGLREAAERLGVHYMTVYRYVRTGRLPAQRDGAEWTVAVADLGLVGPGGKALPRRRTARAERPSRLADRMVAGDEAGAWTVVEGALASGADAGDIYVDLLTPALVAIGEAWRAGDLSVAEEHRASAVAQRIVGRLGPRFARRGRSRGTIVLGAPAGERHSLPGAMLADLLRGSGFEVLDLGVDAPAESFAETALDADRLVAVLVGVTAPGRDAAVRRTVLALRRAAVTAPILVGGRAVSGVAHARKLGADGWSGPNATAAVASVEDAAGHHR